VDQVNAIVAETLHELIDPDGLRRGRDAVRAAPRRRPRHRDRQQQRGGGRRPIGDMLGVDHVIATRMVVADGKYTGEIAFYAYGEGKAEAIREVAAERGYDLAQCWAYSDSATDRPMLEAVGNPVAVNPDKSLRRHAAENGWRLREFRRPVRVRNARMRAMAAPPGPPAAYAGVAVAAGAVGLAWWAGRRH
jgi:hypothetical protein